MSGLHRTVDLAAENARLEQDLAALTAVSLELIRERDQAVADLRRLQQLSLLAGPA